MELVHGVKNAKTQEFLAGRGTQGGRAVIQRSDTQIYQNISNNNNQVSTNYPDERS
jgi:hypothetical protein